MKKLTFLSTTVLFALGAPSPRGWAGTRAGNGGDVVNLILQDARLQLINGVKYLLKRPNTRMASYCHKGMVLSNEQAAECEAFIKMALPQILAINQPMDRNAVLANKPGTLLSINIPNQQNRCFSTDADDHDCFAADAATTSGPNGPIVVRHDFVTSPQANRHNLIALLFHEYGHKIIFKQRYVTDYDEGTTFTWGWQLLDAAAAGFTAYLTEKRDLGSDPIIIDRFQCDTFVDGTPVPANPAHDFIRRFKGDGPNRFRTYETGFCLGEANCPYVPATVDNERYMLRMHIDETRNCTAPKATAALKNNQFELVLLDDNSEVTEVVASYAPPFPNPICKETHDPMTLEYRNMKFVCRYVQTVIK